MSKTSARGRKTKRSPKAGRRADPRYPVPGENGGRLARALVAGLRDSGLDLPLTSHILCACSGGADSTALAVLLSRYGRRVVGERARIILLHVNHGWRGAESDADEAFVRELARGLGVGFRSHRLSEKPKAGESWEAHARALRKDLFRRASTEYEGAPVLTAHTADDQAETRLWRFLTGAFETLGAGILPRHGVEFRPWLTVRRETLRRFLREEGITWREDATNADPRFLRARIRHELMPRIESIFPSAVEAIALEKPGFKTTRKSSRNPPKTPMEAVEAE